MCPSPMLTALGLLPEPSLLSLPFWASREQPTNNACADRVVRTPEDILGTPGEANSFENAGDGGCQHVPEVR